MSMRPVTRSCWQLRPGERLALARRFAECVRAAERDVTPDEFEAWRQAELARQARGVGASPQLDLDLRGAA